ncbi:RICIN domain-containing protein [Nonomuraea fuscirosea]|uniref:RICIN domain-containing protein n=1 Tax=Nonomuraea fuscirosea TaxID=1291556 RepID=UPI00379486CF
MKAVHVKVNGKQEQPRRPSLIGRALINGRFLNKQAVHSMKLRASSSKGATMFRLRLAAAVLAIPMLVLGSVGSASASPRSEGFSADYPPGTPGPFKIANHANQGLCLDTSGNLGWGVYLGRCNSSDSGQRWGWWNGGWLIHLQSGYCLAAVTVSGVNVTQLQHCIDHPIQYWTHRNSAIRNSSTGTERCLSPAAITEGADVEPLPCISSPSRGWSVTYW